MHGCRETPSLILQIQNRAIFLDFYGANYAGHFDPHGALLGRGKCSSNRGLFRNRHGSVCSSLDLAGKNGPTLQPGERIVSSFRGRFFAHSANEA